MFPIPSDEELSVDKIAEYWSRKISPAATPKELRERMISAWWRGELSASGGPRPIGVLRSLHGSEWHQAVVFVGEGDEPVSVLHEDGAIDIDIRICLRVPNADPQSWTDENCKEGLKEIAKNWRESFFNDLALGLRMAVTLTAEQFYAWIEERGFDRPRFWARPENPTRSARRGRLNKKTAREFAASYIEREGVKATQAGFEQAARVKGIRGWRDLLRQSYKDSQAAAGREIKRGRPKNSPAEK